MKSTNEYIVICDFCKSKYIKRVISDDGVDWLGHGRGTPTHYETPEFCPHCEHEIKKAYEIVMDREEKEKEELKKKIEILGGMDNLCFIEVRYADTIGAKNYSYVCDKNIINHYKVGDIIATRNNKLVKLLELTGIDENIAFIELKRISTLKKLEYIPINDFIKLLENKVSSIEKGTLIDTLVELETCMKIAKALKENELKYDTNSLIEDLFKGDK